MTQRADRKGGASAAPEVAPGAAAPAETPEEARLKGLRLAVLKKQVESADGALDINPDKKPMEQTKALEMLGAKARILIDSLLRGQAFTPEDVEKYTDFKTFVEALKTDPFQKAMVGDAHRLIAAELQKMANEGASAKFWADEQCWAGLLRDQVSKFIVDIPEGGKEKKDKSLWEKHAPESVKKFFKDHPTTATFGKILALGAGAYGVFRLLKWMISPGDKKPQSERGLFDKIRSAVAWPLGILGGVSLGVWLGGKMVRELIKDTTGMDIANLGEVIKAFREGRYADGWRLLKEAPDPNENLHHNFRDEIEKKYKIKLANGVLVVFGKDDYQTFRKTSFTERAARAIERIKGGAGEEGGLAMGLLGTVLDADPEAVLESKALNETFEQLEKDGYINPDEMKGKPLDDVIAVAVDNMKSGKGNKKGAGDEKRDDKKEGPGLGGRMLDKLGESAHGFAKDFKETYASWMPKEVKDATDKWTEAGPWAKHPIDNMKATWEWMQAINNNKGKIAISAGGAFIWTGLKWVVISTAEAIVKPLYKLATLHPQDAVDEYLIGTTPFIVFGIARGLKSGNGLLGKLASAIQGGAGGFLYPARVAGDVAYYASEGHFMSHISTFDYGVGIRAKRLKSKAWATLPLTELTSKEVEYQYQADRLLYLEEKEHLISERLAQRRLPEWGTRVAKWKKVEGELDTEATKIKGSLEKVVGGETIMKKARLSRMVAIYGEKYRPVLDAMLADKKVSDMILFNSSRDVMREVLGLNNPQEIIKGITEIKDQEILALIRRHSLLRDKNFVRLLRETPDLFANGALNQAKLEQLVEDAAKAPGRFHRFMSGLVEILGAMKDWTLRRPAIQKLCDSLEGFGKAVRDRVAASSPARRLRQAIDAYRDFRGVKLDAKDMSAIAKFDGDGIQTQAFLAKKGFKVDPFEAADIADKIKKDLKEGQEAVEALAEAKGIKLMVSPEVTIWMGRLRFAGRALAGAGVAFSAGTALYDFYNAATTGVEGRGKLYAGRGALYGVSTAVDAAAVAGSGVAGAGAIALAPILYMGDTAFHSANEGTKTVAEWSETEHTQLVHEWMSTGLDEEFTAGDAYRAVLPFAATEEQIRQEHRETRKKNLAALICQEDRTSEPDPHRMAYFEKIWGFGAMESYDKCLILLKNSKIYAMIQATRLIQKEAGAEHFYVGGVDIMDARFEDPSRGDMSVLIEAEKKEAQESLDPNIRKNAALLSDATLIEFYEQMVMQLEEDIEFLTSLKKYMTYERGINTDQIELRVVTNEQSDKKIELKTGWAAAMQERLLGDGKDMPIAVEEERKKVTDTAACFALYRLAQFFGYHGYQNEAALKGFFTEDRKNALGIYWNGKEWVVNEEGLESDNEVGSELNGTTVQAMIKEMREDPKNILEHRQRALVFSPGDEAYGRQVVQMAKILEDGLKDYAKIKSTRQTPAAELLAANDDREKPDHKIEVVGEGQATA
ncbi:hypothetical protein HZA43_02380 [Candidatus Peregrinibacteria bacterium]|nr:hypothetical protein [Candidatus Peregrinibacteria bacterium]